MKSVRFEDRDSFFQFDLPHKFRPNFSSHPKYCILLYLSLGPVVLDRWPFLFRKDLLQHEAHRHPYLERIGVMYMMKLRYGERFGREANTSWRLLFVFAVSRNYRSFGISSFFAKSNSTFHLAPL